MKQNKRTPSSALAAGQLAPTDLAVEQLADELERQLRERRPTLAAYLDLTILARPLRGGGWDVLGETFASAGDAEEAVKAAIMHQLIAADRKVQ